MTNDQMLWAIACFFNPVGYATRLLNYRIFRRYLNVPLLTVELSFNGCFELTENDADMLVQINGGDIMWQKERLLNIALYQLPSECEFLVWLDCDIVFDRKDWIEAAVEALRKNVLIQPYSIVYDVKPGIGVTDNWQGNISMRRKSMAFRICNGSLDFNHTSTNMLGYYSPGHAWGVHRDALMESGFYDAMILGSGDFAMAMAAVGRENGIINSYGMNHSQANHYRAWSKKWNHALKGSIGVVEGELCHLWHGHLENRGYGTRYTGLTPFHFDPYADIELGSNNCWRWSSDKPGLHQYIRTYFESRKEDSHETLKVPRLLQSVLGTLA